jgi:hypothetical protein
VCEQGWVDVNTVSTRMSLTEEGGGRMATITAVQRPASTVGAPRNIREGPANVGSTGLRLPPPFLREAKTGKNHLNEKITPSSPLVSARDLAKPYQI